MAEAPIAVNDFLFANAPGLAKDDLALMCEVWVGDVCAASWVSKEAMKMAAVVGTYILAEPKIVHLRDVESAYNLVPEETQRALKLLKLFGSIAEFSVERGRLAIKAHVSYGQRVRHAALREGYAHVMATAAASEADRSATANASALRAISAHEAAATDLASLQPELPLVVNG